MIVVLAGKSVKGNVTINVTDDAANSEDAERVPM